MSMRDDAIAVLRTSYEPITATDLASMTGARLDSLSSVLKRMCDEGIFVRYEGHGPRGIRLHARGAFVTYAATTAVIDALRSAIGASFHEPHVTFSECDDADCLEWWKGSKNVTVYINAEGIVEGLRVWGVNIHTEMSDFRDVQGLIEAYRWMLT